MSDGLDVEEGSCNDVVNCAIFVASLAALLALAAAARPSNARQLSSLSRAALPVLYVCAEVFELWSEFFERSIFVHALEDVLECHGLNEGHVPVLMGWLLPHTIVLALLLLAVARGLLALLVRATVRQLTEALDHEEAPGSMAMAITAALSDTLTATVVLFSATHVLLARITFRGLQTGDLAFWCPATLLVAALNIATPAGVLAWIVRWARSHQQGARRGPMVAPPKSDVHTAALCAASSLVNSEPWATWQLLGNLLAVAGLELSRAAGQPSLGLAWAQGLVFCELLLLLWPRWLADVRLLRFNALTRAALLTATRLQQVTGVEAACAWSAAAALCGAVALAMALAAGWTAQGCNVLPRMLHSRKRTVAPASLDAQSTFVRDLSQGLLFVALSEPEQVAELCKGLSADESLCLRNASELVLRRLRSAAEVASCAAAEPGGGNSSPERRCWNEKSNTSHQTMWSEAASGSRDWVAPLPLLGTDEETLAGQRSIDRKWLLDHFVPASSGPSPVVSPRPSNSSRSAKHSLHRSRSNELDRKQHVLLRSRSSDAKSHSHEDRRRLLRSRSSDAKSWSYEDSGGSGAKLELPDLRPAARTINCLMPREATSIVPKARSDNGTEPIAFSRGLSWDSICSGGSHEAPCCGCDTNGSGGGKLAVPSEDALGWASETSGSSLSTSDLWQVAIRSYSQDLTPRDKGEITLPDIQRNLEFLKAENLRLRRETEQMQGAAGEWSGKRPSDEEIRPTVSSHLVSRQLPPEMPPEMPPEIPQDLPLELPNSVAEMLALPSELPNGSSVSHGTWEVLPLEEEVATNASNGQKASSTQEPCSTTTEEAASSHSPRVPSGSEMEGAGEAAAELSKEEQWEKWRARREARKAKMSNKLKYGQWLKNMAGDG